MVAVTLLRCPVGEITVSSTCLHCIQLPLSLLLVRSQLLQSRLCDRKLGAGSVAKLAQALNLQTHEHASQPSKHQNAVTAATDTPLLQARTWHFFTPAWQDALAQ